MKYFLGHPRGIRTCSSVSQTERRKTLAGAPRRFAKTTAFTSSLSTMNVIGLTSCLV